MSLQRGNRRILDQQCVARIRRNENTIDSIGAAPKEVSFVREEADVELQHIGLTSDNPEVFDRVVTKARLKHEGVGAIPAAETVIPHTAIQDIGLIPSDQRVIAVAPS